MNLVYSFVKGEFAKALGELRQPIAKAMTAAIREAGETALSEGRSEIAAAGFSKSFQNGWVAAYFPKKGQSLRPAVRLRHRVNYARVFEEGAQITGKPMLWLPTDNVPNDTGSRKLTPRKYIERIGPLKSVNIPGKRPMLVGRGSRRTILRATSKAVRLRKNALSRGVFGGFVPMFIGVRAVNIRKRFGLYAVISRAASRLAEFYIKNVKN